MSKTKNSVTRRIAALMLAIMTTLSLVCVANAATTTENVSFTAIGYYDSYTEKIEPATTTSFYFVASDGTAAVASFTDDADEAAAHNYYIAVDASQIEGVTVKDYAYADEEDFTTTLTEAAAAIAKTCGSSYSSIYSFVTVIYEGEENTAFVDDEAQVIDDNTPATPTFQSITSGNKKLTVKWDRSDSYPDGFQIRYRVSGTSTWKTKTCAGAYTNKYIYTAITGLKAGTEYELQIRAYNIVNAEEDVYGGDYVYSEWSTSAYATTK